MDHPRLNHFHLLHHPHSPTIPRPLHLHSSLAIHRGPRLASPDWIQNFSPIPWQGSCETLGDTRMAKQASRVCPYMSNTTPAHRLPGPNWSDPDVPQALQGKLVRITPSLGCIKPHCRLYENIWGWFPRMKNGKFPHCSGLSYLLARGHAVSSPR